MGGSLAPLTIDRTADIKAMGILRQVMALVADAACRRRAPREPAACQRGSVSKATAAGNAWIHTIFQLVASPPKLRATSGRLFAWRIPR
jgi:hypothetical protein